MTRAPVILMCAAAWARPVPGQTGSQASRGTANLEDDPTRFEAEIRAFKAADRASLRYPAG